MRLWSIHPKYLDSRGLVALWREGLLARKVLAGWTKGYKNHPQLLRFKSHPKPLQAIDFYLHQIFQEAKGRGFSFDHRKIGRRAKVGRIKIASGQIRYEMEHLLKKIRKRDPGWLKNIKDRRRIAPHPLFKKILGRTAFWEKIK